MNDATIKAQVHRFRDYVAISIHDGSTVYLKPSDARALSAALTKVAVSVVSEEFSKSTDTTTAMTFEGKV